MEIKQYEIWLADLNPSIGTEPGKTRPVVIIQTDLLNDVHLSTIICPVSTNVVKESTILRLHLNDKQLNKASDVLIDQLRAIDNKRFIKKIGILKKEQVLKLKENLKIILEL